MLDEQGFLDPSGGRYCVTKGIEAKNSMGYARM